MNRLLADLLAEVACTGYAIVPKWRITRWYGQGHFTINIRRDLVEKWTDLITEELEWEEEIIKKSNLTIADYSYAGKNGEILLLNSHGFFKENQ